MNWEEHYNSATKHVALGECAIRTATKSKWQKLVEAVGL